MGVTNLLTKRDDPPSSSIPFPKSCLEPSASKMVGEISENHPFLATCQVCMAGLLEFFTHRFHNKKLSKTVDRSKKNAKKMEPIVFFFDCRHFIRWNRLRSESDETVHSLDETSVVKPCFTDRGFISCNTWTMRIFWSWSTFYLQLLQISRISVPWFGLEKKSKKMVKKSGEFG